MQKQEKMDDLGFCPSFSCYSSGSSASTAAAKVSCEFKQAQTHELSDIDAEDFEFTLLLGDEGVSAEEIGSEDRIIFPVFNRDLLINDEEDSEVKLGNDRNDDASSSIMIPLRQLFIDDREEPSSSTSSEAEDLERVPSGTYCIWRPKVELGQSPLMKCKKSSSTGSGSKRWRIRDLLRRSNSEGKDPMVLFTPNKIEVPKHKRNSVEVAKVAGKLKGSASPSVHEQFYVQKRTEKEGGKMKSYLPYRQDLLGFFTNVNGLGKKFPF